jgi:PAS domain S-box-containing protein
VRHPGSIADTGRSFADQPVFAKLLGGTQPSVALLPSLVDGREKIYAVQSVTGFSVAVGASVQKAAVLEAWYVQAMHSAVRTSILCLSVMLLMWLVLRELRRREQAEEGLRVQTALLDELFESAPEAIVMLDLQERVTRVNREFTRMFGYAAAEAQGRPLGRLIVPDDLLQEANAWPAALHKDSMQAARRSVCARTARGFTSRYWARPFSPPPARSPATPFTAT